jgi:CubicO group peptidase (beta-lactamase class C family)
METQAIDTLFEKAVEGGVFPGVVATAGDRDGVLYEGAFGTGADTVFALASMTKALVSVAALQLVEQGRLELDQPVADVLPAFGDLQVLEGYDGDQPRLRPPASQATIRQLLNHTSGLGYWFANADIRRYHQLTGTPDPSTSKRAMLDVPLAWDPGTRWEYGTSTDWLGAVVEEVAGTDLDRHCREHVFGPLGMVDTTFRPDEAQRARGLAVHFRMPDGSLVAMPAAEWEDPEMCSGGGGGRGTARDYLRFMRALLRGGELDGERILRSETVDLAFSDHMGAIELPTVIRSAFPELANDIISMPVAQGWGLGFHLVLEDVPGMRRAGTGDWAGLFNCFYWIDREQGVAGTVMTQVLPFFDAGILEAAMGFETAVYAGVQEPAAA